MKNRTGAQSKLFTVILLIAIVGITSLAVAQANDVVTINGGRKTLFLKPPSHSAVPSVALPAGVITIYSNLGQGDQTYNPNAGVGILGPNAGQPWPEEVGSAFTPTADHLVQAIRVGTTYVQGTNGIILSLNEDDHGIPGKQLAGGKFMNLPRFGSCCTLQTGKGASGVQIKANTQYWVVVRPVAKDTYAVWNDNFNEVQGTWSNNIGSGWDTSYQVLGAFGVYGK